MDIDEIKSLWAPFGLRSSPFFQDELSVAGDNHPVALFVAREEERRRVLRRLISDQKSRTIVQGDAGVGKTSFVNRIKADALAMGIRSYPTPIRITSETTLGTFAADALRTIVRLRPNQTGDSGGFWRRTVRLLEGEDLVDGSLSVGGVGIGVARRRISAEAPADDLYEHLGEALERVAADTGGGVLLHVNNLENLGRRETGEAAVLIQDLRDYLQLDGAHWVFVGSTGIDEDVFRRSTQVGGIFPEAETLQPLGSDTIGELLDLRYQHLREGNLVEPVSLADGARLYERYAGDLRNFLRLLSDASERRLGLDGIRPMMAEEVIRAVQPLYARSLARTLGEGDFTHLARLVGALSNDEAGSEFRVTDAAETLGVTQAGASHIVARLVEKKMILRSRESGRSVYYQPTGMAMVALGDI